MSLLRDLGKATECPTSNWSWFQDIDPLQIPITSKAVKSIDRDEFGGKSPESGCWGFLFSIPLEKWNSGAGGTKDLRRSKLGRLASKIQSTWNRELPMLLQLSKVKDSLSLGSPSLLRWTEEALIDQVVDGKIQNGRFRSKILP